MLTASEKISITKLHQLAEKLELVLITYNRANNLDHTLEQLRGCPFAFCKITILDNCSPDNTPEVIQKHLPYFENMVYQRHKTNIGGNANILRAAETSNSIYTWIICDDDEFDFSDCEDVIDVILEEKAALIHMGAHAVLSWEPTAGVFATPKELLARGYTFFNNSSFVPCNLFKTELMYKSLDAAYQNISNWYPHLIFIINFFYNNKPLYVAKRRIVTASVVDTGLHYDAWLNRWLNTCLLMKSRKDTRLMFFDIYFGENKFVSLAKLTFHAWDRQMRFYTLKRTFNVYGILGFLYMLAYVLVTGLAFPVIKMNKKINNN